MGNINQYVRTLLSHDLSVQKDLSRNLINIRALAKYLIETYSLNASLDAVISAVRRFRTERVFEKEENKIMDAIRGASVFIRNNIACIALGLKPFELMGRVCTKLPMKEGFRVITGSQQTKLLIPTDDVEAIKNSFSKQKIKHVEMELTEMSIQVKQTAIKTKGVLARISHELSLHGINVMEIIVDPPEILIYVKDKDAVDAHKALSNII